MTTKERDAVVTNRLLQNAKGFFARLFSKILVAYRNLSSKAITAIKSQEKESQKQLPPKKTRVSLSKKPASKKTSLKVDFTVFNNAVKKIAKSFDRYRRQFFNLVVANIDATRKSERMTSVRKLALSKANQLVSTKDWLVLLCKRVARKIVEEYNRFVTFLRSKKIQNSLSKTTRQTLSLGMLIWSDIVNASLAVYNALTSTRVKLVIHSIAQIIKIQAVKSYNWLMDPCFYKRIPRIVIIITGLLFFYWMLFQFPLSRAEMLMNSNDPVITAEAIRLELAARALNAQILGSAAILVLSFWFIIVLLKDVLGNKQIKK